MDDDEFYVQPREFTQDEEDEYQLILGTTREVLYPATVNRFLTSINGQCYSINYNQDDAIIRRNYENTLINYRNIMREWNQDQDTVLRNYYLQVYRPYALESEDAELLIKIHNKMRIDSLIDEIIDSFWRTREHTFFNMYFTLNDNDENYFRNLIYDYIKIILSNLDTTSPIRFRSIFTRGIGSEETAIIITYNPNILTQKDLNTLFSTMESYLRDVHTKHLYLFK